MIDLNMSEDNIFSEELLVAREFNFSLKTAGFSGIVTLQRKLRSADNWADVAEFEADYEGYDVQPGGGLFRFGIKTGDYTAGSARGMLSGVYI